MTEKLPKYVKRVVDRYGNPRFYFYREGYPRQRLEGAPGEAVFEAGYLAAMTVEIAAPAPRIDRTPKPLAPSNEVTFSELARRYYLSAGFISLRDVTRSTYRNVIERLREEYGEAPVVSLDRRGVRAIMAKHADRPGSANQFRKILHILMQFAIEEEIRDDNPCMTVKRLKMAGDGFKTWTEDHIAAYLERHEEGSRARLALALLLYTGQRRADVVELGPGNVRRGLICLTQSKTGVHLEIPIHPALAAELKACGEHETFLRTREGKAFTPAGFGNWFRDRCNEAGIPGGYSAHGLRKAACRRLAEAGCTAHEIMAISGHTTLAEVERYTKAASQKRMAGGAMKKLAPENKSENSEESLKTRWQDRILALPREMRHSNDNNAFSSGLLPDPTAGDRRDPSDPEDFNL